MSSHEPATTLSKCPLRRICAGFLPWWDDSPCEACTKVTEAEKQGLETIDNGGQSQPGGEG